MAKAQSQSSTIVAVFDDFQTAERAARAVSEAGIPRNQVQVQSNFRTGAAGRSGDTETEHEGGIRGFFHRLFGSSHEDAGHYAEAVRRGSAVVCLTATPDQVERVSDILNDNGAIDLNKRVAEYQQSGYREYDPQSPAYSLEETRRERERFSGGSPQASIPVVEEEIQVGKRAVQRGGVRVYSQVVEEPVEQEVRLREERVNVERRPVNRPLEPGEAARMKDQNIEVREMAEEPVVQKRSRVKEEIVVDKSATERTEKVRDTVRRTEVKVDRLSGAGANEPVGIDTSDFRRDYETNYASSGEPYERMEPAYLYGMRMAQDPRYEGRSWDSVENDLRSDYSKTYPGGVWDRMRNAIRYGWDKVSGGRS